MTPAISSSRNLLPLPSGRAAFRKSRAGDSRHSRRPAFPSGSSRSCGGRRSLECERPPTAAAGPRLQTCCGCGRGRGGQGTRGARTWPRHPWGPGPTLAGLGHEPASAVQSLSLHVPALFCSVPTPPQAAFLCEGTTVTTSCPGPHAAYSSLSGGGLLPPSGCRKSPPWPVHPSPSTRGGGGGGP